MRYSAVTIRTAQHLRTLGCTYNEIQEELGLKIAKSTLFHWCKFIPLSPEYIEKVKALNKRSWAKARRISTSNREKRRQEFFAELTRINTPIAKLVQAEQVAKIALALLCLGEASKTKNGVTRGFNLSSTDPRIITIFLNLLKKCYDFKLDKVRCTVQCRADQNIPALNEFWSKHTGIPLSLFYKGRVDKRTIGKPTMRKNYKGVLKIDYFNSKVQFDLESLADMIYNQIR